MDIDIEKKQMHFLNKKNINYIYNININNYKLIIFILTYNNIFNNKYYLY